MPELKSNLAQLFSAESFMPHGHCYLWRPDILWLNVGSDAFIALSYYAIPLFLIYFVRKRTDLEFNWIFIMFAAFIVGCGTTHLMEIWTVWNPQYGLQGIVKLLTAGVSLATAIALAPLMPKVLRLPSPRQMDEKRKELERLNRQLQTINATLEQRVEIQTRVVKDHAERFRHVIESTPNGILMIDDKGKIVLCNAEIEILFGYQRDEIIGESVEVLIPDRFRNDHPAHRNSFFRAPKTKQMGSGRDLYGLRKDRREIPVEIGLNPINTSEGAFVLASVVDITKRKQMEKSVQENSMEIERRNHEMEQFVYTISHDLKSPIVTSTGFVGVIKEDLAAKQYDRIPDSLARVERANDRMSQLINDLLQLSRVGRLQLELERLQVSSVIEQVRENLAPKLEEKRTTLRIQEDTPIINADAGRVLQVFENLIMNALVYACNGPVKVNEISIGGMESKNEVLIFVKDNGPGIDPQYHEKIFGLFQRLHADNRGTGIGLAIVKRIMEQHGGRVWVESKVGQGATFWLAFPKLISVPKGDEYE